MRWAPALLVLLVVPAIALGDERPDAVGTLRLRVVEEASGRDTPARLTVVDEAGRSYVAPAALPVVGECMSAAPASWAEAPRGGFPADGIVDPATGARAFYLDRAAEMELAPGRYRVTVSKGPEFQERSLAVEVVADQSTDVTVALSRWIDMPAEGWVSADGHLHIPRPTREHDPLIAAWMRAEDLHVAQLLQMGRPGEIVGARQYAFGERGRHLEEGVLLAPGQENPRTWLLGHGVVLGASEYLDPGERYLVYQPVWRRAHAEGALVGYAHWHPPGVLIDAPTGLVDFLEVLQVDTPNYDLLHRLWSLGLDVAPVAGTDFPCIGDLPGADRFYAHVPPPFTWERWVEAVRRGETFVTNGPMLQLDVGGAGIGGSLELSQPGSVRVRGEARFDPTRDDLRTLDLIRDGEVVHRVAAPTELGRFSFEVDLPIEASGWIALRASGAKIDRRPHGTRRRETEAHTGAVFVDVAGTPDRGTGPRARPLARAAQDDLAQVRRRLEESGERLLLGAPDWLRGVDLETLRRSRPEVLEEIDSAAAWYGRRAGPADGADSGDRSTPPETEAAATDPAASGESPDSGTPSRSPGDASRPPP